MLAMVSRLTLCDIQARAALQSFSTACFRERCANISKPSNKSRHLFEGFSGPAERAEAVFLFISSEFRLKFRSSVFCD